MRMTMVSGAIVGTRHTCKSGHYQWARSASEHDDARTKEVLSDAGKIPDHKIPDLALPFLHKHLQTQLRFEPQGVGNLWTTVRGKK